METIEMTDDDILKVARECGGVADDQTIVLYHTELITFARRIAAMQREEIAAWCDQQRLFGPNFAEAIRRMSDE